ncbi:MAG: hypothetical protein K2I72_01435, partial [Bacilli bacterium]|nr:hypothetical protein [Bacilli bacterium]
PCEKYLLVVSQSVYLKELGITIPDENMLKCESEEDISNYLAFLNEDHIKPYIPSVELISHISSTRERKYEEALKEYYATRKDFTNIMKLVGNDSNYFEFFYARIKNKIVCITRGGATNEKKEFVSVMFYTIRSDCVGLLSHALLHECGHIIDQNQEGIGFESNDDFEENSRRNPYDKAFRKYEKFNEVLNDIFTMEANRYLQDQGIYLIEPPKFTLQDTSNCNTSLITKNLLKPLLQKFRSQVIKAKVNAKPEELTKYIGKDNFEELVDVVNKVDYLSGKGVESKIDKFPEDEMVIEYFEQIERVQQVYMNIDDYYASNFETSPENNYEDSQRKVS